MEQNEIETLKREISELKEKRNEGSIFEKALPIILGGAIAIFSSTISIFFTYFLESANKNKSESRKKELLLSALCDKNYIKDAGLWRRLSTLSSFIGSNPQETRSLLIQIGARAALTREADFQYSIKKIDRFDANGVLLGTTIESEHTQLSPFDLAQIKSADKEGEIWGLESLHPTKLNLKSTGDREKFAAEFRNICKAEWENTL